MGLRMEKIYFEGSLKHLTFRGGGGGSWKANIEAGLPKKGGGMDSLKI